MKKSLARWIYAGLCVVLLVSSGCVLPSLRTSVGASVAVPKAAAPKPAQGEAPADPNAAVPGFALDVMLGVMIRTTVNTFLPDITKPKQIKKFLERHISRQGKLKPLDMTIYGLTFMPEIGYSLDTQLFPAKLVVGFGMQLSAWRLEGMPDVSHILQFLLPGSWAIGYIPNLVLAGNDNGVFPGMRNTLYFHLAYGLVSFELQHEFYLAGGEFAHVGRLMVGVNLGLLVPALFLRRGRRKLPM